MNPISDSGCMSDFDCPEGLKLFNQEVKKEFMGTKWSPTGIIK